MAIFELSKYCKFSKNWKISMGFEWTLIHMLEQKQKYPWHPSTSEEQIKLFLKKKVTKRGEWHTLIRPLQLCKEESHSNLCRSNRNEVRCLKMPFGKSKDIASFESTRKKSTRWTDRLIWYFHLSYFDRPSQHMCKRGSTASE